MVFFCVLKGENLKSKQQSVGRQACVIFELDTLTIFI